MDIFQNLKKFGNSTALIEDNLNEISYSEILEETIKISKHIDGRSLIIIFSSNTIESIIGYISFCIKKNVVMLVERNINQSNANKLIYNYNPDYIFLPKLSHLNFNNNFEIIFNYKNYLLLKSIKKITKILHKELSILLPTSGTTGNSKFVKISNRNILSNTRSIIDYLHINKNHKSITILSMHYSYGMSILNTHLSVGAKIVVTEEKITSKPFWNLLKSSRVTSISGVPFIYETFDKLKIQEMDLPYIKYFTQAGGKLKKNLVIKFANYCIKNDKEFIIMYGQTEASPRMSYLPFKDILRKPDSIGKAINNCRFEIQDNDGNIIKEINKSGQLIFYGDNVSMGYANNFLDLKNGYNNKGILKTGDIATKDQENFYYILGRIDRSVKIAGIRINLDNIEKTLFDFGYEIVCLINENKLIIHIKCKSDFDKMKKKITSIVYSEFNINKNLLLLKKISEFPRNSDGKIIYKNLI